MSRPFSLGKIVYSEYSPLFQPWAMEYPMNIAHDRPPTLAEDMRDILFKVLPRSFFGLIIYSVLLLRGRLPAKLRRTISIAVIVGWTLTAFTATLFYTLSPAEAGLSYAVTAATCFSFLVMVIAGSLTYNRVNYGFYL
jgi:hypothetical protein